VEEQMSQPPLRPLHSEASLVASKLAQFRRLSTADLIGSLKPGTAGSLKARPEGTVLDGHHRLAVLRERGVDVDALPCEIMAKEPPDGGENP
jgi:ParB-like chromosome segregation protein Spo0J